MKETDLAKPVIAWLRQWHWDVFQEVVVGGSAIDVVGRRGEQIAAVELKVVLGFDVIAQARQWLGRASVTYVAVPLGKRSDGRREALEYCRHLGLGVLEVDPRGAWDRVCRDGVSMAVAARYYRSIEGKIAGCLYEAQKDFTPAGSPGAPRWTPFKEFAGRVLREVEAKPGITARELIAELGKCHYSSDAAARACVLRWARSGVISGIEVRVEDGGPRLYPAQAKKGAA